MVTCNRNIIKTIESENIDDVISDFNETTCQNLNPNADMLDFRTDMDQLHFFEKTELLQFAPFLFIILTDHDNQEVIKHAKTYG